MLVNTEQPTVADWGTLSAGQTLGQTFVAKYAGLTGIYFYLSPQEIGDGEIRLHLRSSPQAVDDLAVSMNTLPVEAVKVHGYFGFFVPAQASSNQEYYYAFLEVTGSGDVQVGKAPGGTYLDGALYQNGTPEDAQATFQLSYSRQKAALGLAEEAVSWVGILAIGFFLFILPGWGLLSLLWPGWGAITWPEKLGLSAGLSLAVYPLLLLWTDIIGLHLGAIYAWLPPLVGLGIILWRNRKRLSVRAFSRFTVRTSLHVDLSTLPWAEVAFIGILALIVLTRFWAIRSLDIPMWGDSYQHTMIAQLLVDHGGLFNSWKPYAELTTFTYHFGFHTAAAVFDWITHLDMPKAVLWVGQLLNVLAVIVLYPLATKVGRSKWAGVVAVLVAGLLSPMPMYYVNWGRYTQLAGQVILPAVIYLAWTTLEREAQMIESPVLGEESKWFKWRRCIPFDTGQMAIMWIVMGGLALTHFRILIFAVLFFVAFFILLVRRETWRILLVRVFWIGMGSGLLFLPWFIHTFAGKILLIFANQISTPSSAVLDWTKRYNTIGQLSTYLPGLLWLLLPVGISLGLWRRDKGVALISLWSSLIMLAANPQWLHLPGEGAITNFAVFIAAYIPASLLAGYLLAQVTSYKLKVERVRQSLALSLLILVFMFAVGAWGAYVQRSVLRVGLHAMVTCPDMRAVEWIQENTPQDARFLVDSFFAYNDSSVVGSDGGLWLPLLAQRHTTLPPLNYASEQGPRTDYVQWINALYTEIINQGIASPEALALLDERGITYVYIGQRQGRVNYGGPEMLVPEQLLASPNFRPVYHQDRVWIFEVVQ